MLGEPSQNDITGEKYEVLVSFNQFDTNLDISFWEDRLSPSDCPVETSVGHLLN